MANWNHPEQTPTIPIKFGNIPGQTIVLTPDSRIVCRQQLTDPEFYQEVKAGLLDGSVVALDQRSDKLMIGTDVVSLTSPEGVKALAESQQGWVGIPPENRFLGGLITEAQRIQGMEQNWQGVKAVGR